MEHKIHNHLCLGIEKMFTEIMQFYYITYMATPSAPSSLNLQFWYLFSSHHYYTFSLSDLCPGVEKIQEIYINFMLFTRKYSPLEGGRCKTYNFLSLYPTDVTRGIRLLWSSPQTRDTHT